MNMISTALKQNAALDQLKLQLMFEKLNEAEIEPFAASAHARIYAKGEYLYMDGELARNFYFVCNGWVKFLHVTKDGEEIILAMLGKNSVTGEASLFENGYHAATAQIVEEALVYIVPISILKSQIQKNSQLALNMMSSMIQYQRRHQMQIEQFLLYSAPQRIGCFILDLCQEQGHKDGFVIDIELPYDKRLIANMLGMKGPTFSRALNALRIATGTTTNGSHVSIKSLSRLLSFVDGCYLTHHVGGQMRLKASELPS